ncbi:MAG: M6 family metalloprotease domain-containing protein [Candidatus Marinimicrobia bacterium]|nr:M6 family metalloprotease domain-containing protein [Candidatus Neomarinimicrobiota bacterium]
MSRWPIHLPQTYAYYENGDNGFGRSREFVSDVIQAVDSTLTIDFSPYDNDGNQLVDALFIVHAGSGAEIGATNEIWSHAWSLAAPLAVTGGVSISRYSIEPEYWDLDDDDVFDTGEDMTIGVYAHEMGHAAFGLPDLYDRDGTSSGLGRWTLLAGGSWNGTLGSSPALPDAWTHIQMGYITPIIHSANSAGYVIAPVADSAEVHLLWTDGGAGNEYFLVENRQLLSFDAALPGGGLLIYHVDETVGTQNDNEWYPGYTASGHYLVALEQADGNWDLETSTNSGDGGDPFPGSTASTTFNAASTPDSRDYAGSDTYVAVQNISPSNIVMTADLNVIIANPPVIAVTPDSLSENLLAGDTAVQFLTIDNSAGGSELVFEISIEGVEAATTSMNVRYRDFGQELNNDLRLQRTEKVAHSKSILLPASGLKTPKKWEDYRQTSQNNRTILKLHPNGNIPDITQQTLPVVIEDPVGDGGVVDITVLRGASISEVLEIEMEFATAIDPFDFGGFLQLDIDQDSTTGVPSFGYPEQDIGGEYEIAFFSLGSGVVDLFDAITFEYIGSYPVVIETYTLRFSIPLAHIGNDDGNMDVTGVVGNFSGPTDWFPDQGHGTIGGVSGWLSVAPTAGTVPAGSVLDIAVTFDATQLDEGLYKANLIVTSNDPLNSEVHVPVVLRVLPPPIDPAQIVAVEDYPGDQGGWVEVVWRAAPDDNHFSDTPVEGYTVWMRNPYPSDMVSGMVTPSGENTGTNLLNSVGGIVRGDQAGASAPTGGDASQRRS